MKKYIFSAVLAFGMLASPVFASATGLTSSQIQSILSLLSVFGADSATIANVQTALNGGTQTSTGTSFCYNFNSDLTVGSNGADVSALNKAFANSGINITADTSMGHTSNFTEDNAHDVVAFQAKYGINQTGYVGPLTRGKLNALYGCGNSQQITQPTNITSVQAPTIFFISPSSANIGDTVYVYGTNFDQNTFIALGANSIEGTVQPNAITVFPSKNSFSFVVPSISVGTHTIAVGEKGSSGAMSNSVTLNVVQTPTISYIKPTSVKAGATVYVYGTNFNPNTYIAFDGDFGQTIWPDNAPASGSKGFSFTVPSNASIGNHTVQVNEKGASFPSSNSVSLSVVQ